MTSVQVLNNLKRHGAPPTLAQAIADACPQSDENSAAVFLESLSIAAWDAAADTKYGSERPPVRAIA